jgi:hypothetical protein
MQEINLLLVDDPSPDYRGAAPPGQRRQIRRMGPLRSGGQHRLGRLPGMGPVPV